MLFGKIIGRLTPAIVYEGLEQVPLLWLEPLTKNLKPSGKTAIVVADSTKQAGIGQYVYYIGGRDAALTLEKTFVPVDHAISGIIDDINLEDK